MVKKKAKSFWARLFVIGTLLGGTSGCATQQKYKIIERPDPVTGEMRRFSIEERHLGKVSWPEDRERIKKAEEAAKEAEMGKIRADAPLWARAVWPFVKPYYKPPKKRELLPPPGKRVVYRNKEK